MMQITRHNLEANTLSSKVISCPVQIQYVSENRHISKWRHFYTKSTSKAGPDIIVSFGKAWNRDRCFTGDILSSRLSNKLQIHATKDILVHATHYIILALKNPIYPKKLDISKVTKIRHRGPRKKITKNTTEKNNLKTKWITRYCWIWTANSWRKSRVFHSEKFENSPLVTTRVKIVIFSGP